MTDMNARNVAVGDYIYAHVPHAVEKQLAEVWEVYGHTSTVRCYINGVDYQIESYETIQKNSIEWTMAAEIHYARLKVQRIERAAEKLEQYVLGLFGQAIYHATEEEWCDRFDDILNDAIIECPDEDLRDRLPRRSREYDVELTIRGIMETVYSVTVTAKSEEEALQMAHDQMGDPDTLLTDAAKRECFEDISNPHESVVEV